DGRPPVSRRSSAKPLDDDVSLADLRPAFRSGVVRAITNVEGASGGERSVVDFCRGRPDRHPGAAGRALWRTTRAEPGDTDSRNRCAGISARAGCPGHRRGKLCANCGRSEEHTSELQSLTNLVCRLLLEKKKTPTRNPQLDRLLATGVPVLTGRTSQEPLGKQRLAVALAVYHEFTLRQHAGTQQK